MLENLAEAGAIADEAVVVWEHLSGKPMPWPAKFGVEQRRKYGSTEIDIAVFEGSGGSQ
jgi:16S rRNA G966 N2-methylase RsmD